MIAHLTPTGTDSSGATIWAAEQAFGVSLPARPGVTQQVSLSITNAGDVTVDAVGIVLDQMSTATDVGVVPGTPDPGGRLPSTVEVAQPYPGEPQRQCQHGMWVKARAMRDGLSDASNRIEGTWTTWGDDGTCRHAGVTEMQVVPGNKKTYCSGDTIGTIATGCKWTHELTPPYSSALNQTGDYSYNYVAASGYDFEMDAGLKTNRDVSYATQYCRWRGNLPDDTLQCDAHQYT